MIRQHHDPQPPGHGDRAGIEPDPNHPSRAMADRSDNGYNKGPSRSS